MSELSQVTIERRGRIAIVRFDRGDGINALSHGLMVELTEAARSFENDSETSAVVLTGSDKVFSRGLDLKDDRLNEAPALPLAERRLRLAAGARMTRAWATLEPLTIAAVEGWCIGGGVALAAMCDLRIAGAAATFVTPEIERGMNLGWGTVPRLTALLGPARAKRLILLAERLPAERALAWGLVDEVAAAGEALSAARRWAERAAGLPPVPLRMGKAAIEQAAGALSGAVSYMDGDQFLLTWTSDDFREGVESFLEKRPPRYTGG